jgi:hypothetical protein
MLVLTGILKVLVLEIIRFWNNIYYTQVRFQQ